MRIQIRFVRAWSHFKLAKKFEACIKTWCVRVPWKFFVSSFEAHNAAHFPKLRYDFSWFDRRERRRLRNRISGGKKRCLITSSSVNSMETQLRIRAAVYPLPPPPLSLALSFFPPPSISLTISMSIASRISKPEARYSVHGVRKVAFIRRANFINPRKKFPLPWIVEQNF